MRDHETENDTAALVAAAFELQVEQGDPKPYARGETVTDRDDNCAGLRPRADRREQRLFVAPPKA